MDSLDALDDIRAMVRKLLAAEVWDSEIRFTVEDECLNWQEERSLERRSAQTLDEAEQAAQRDLNGDAPTSRGPVCDTTSG